MLVLGIETSCDDTSAAVLENGVNLRSNVVSSQDHIHSRFGGIVPELAGRAHIERIHQIIEQALKEANINVDIIDLIAVTVGPVDDDHVVTRHHGHSRPGGRQY